MEIIRIMVRGTSDPSRFAGFPDLDSLLNWMESQYGGRNDNQSDSQPPISDNDLIYVYEIDPDVQTLISSPEFQKLRENLKAKVFQDLEFTRAFAKFISDGGKFIVVPNAEMALYHAGPPPSITIKDSHISPTDYALNAMVFAIAHEIYHHTYQWSGVLDREAWARNEAIASLMAYKVANRLGITSVPGDSFNLQSIFSRAANANSDEDAMDALIEYFRNKYPG